MPSPHELRSAFLPARLHGWHWPRKFGGCKSEIFEGKGDVCAQLAETELSLSRFITKSRRDPLAEKRGNVTNLNYFGRFLRLIFHQLCCSDEKHRGKDIQRLVGWSDNCFRGLHVLVHPSDQNIKPQIDPQESLTSLQFHIDEWLTLKPSCTVLFIQPNASYQVLYPILPDLLDCNPFRESPDLQMTRGSAQVLSSVGLQVPAEIQHLVEVLTDTRRLLSDCQLHPEISSQLIGYLFYFINASLFNSLMERGNSASVRKKRNLPNVLWGTAVCAVFLLIVHLLFPHPLQVCCRVSCKKAWVNNG